MNHLPPCTTEQESRTLSRVETCVVAIDLSEAPGPEHLDFIVLHEYRDAKVALLEPRPASGSMERAIRLLHASLKLHEKTRDNGPCGGWGTTSPLASLTVVPFNSPSLLALKPRVKSRVTGGFTELVRQDEVLVLSYEGPGDISLADKFEATWLVTSDSSSH
nr:hypothetical protein Iba_chr08dCG3710 [Ipomoea batatas]